jgi:hypothetical protein
MRSSAKGSRAARRDREPSSRWLPAHEKRAGLGVWKVGNCRRDRAAIKAWKRTAPFETAKLGELSTALAVLIDSGGYVVLRRFDSWPSLPAPPVGGEIISTEMPEDSSRGL